MILLDTYAWVEYFRGSKKGEIVKKIIKENACFTSAISLAELSQWISKENIDRKKILDFVKKQSIILKLENDLLEKAGIINNHKKTKEKISNFGMIDSIILATAKAYSLKLVTGDKHFASEKESIII